MNDPHGDKRPGGDRWRNEGNRQSERSYNQGRGNDEDRGFFERAGDEVRSWFGDDDAEQRRESDERRWEGEHGVSGKRDNHYGSDRQERSGSFGGGFGNQTGDSWNRDRPGVRYGSPERGSSGGWGSEHGSRDVGRERSSSSWGNESSGGARSGNIGGRSRGNERSENRYGGFTSAGGGGNRQQDPHYSEWRNRQIQSLDQDYDEYRREHQSRFEQDFGNWRTRRGEQRSSLGRVTEHMEVIGSDGEKIGVVDKVRGDRIILTRNDENAGGVHHSIPCSWIEKVEDKVTVNKSREEAMLQWRDEDRNRALFEREDSGSEGPHVLNRSFSGTYGKDD